MCCGLGMENAQLSVCTCYDGQGCCNCKNPGGDQVWLQDRLHDHELQLLQIWSGLYPCMW